jgi:hypothetical protein
VLVRLKEEASNQNISHCPFSILHSSQHLHSMKKTFATFLLFFTITSFSMAQDYELVKLETEKTCPSYEIRKKGKAVKLPEDIEEALECPPTIGFYDGKYLIYDNDEEAIMRYDVENDKKETIFTYPEDVDGISNPAWSPSKKYAAFIAINQEKTHGYSLITKIIVIDMQAGMLNINRKREYIFPVNFNCKKNCTAIVGEDFYFESDKVLVYKRSLKQKSKPGAMEKVELK